MSEIRWQVRWRNLFKKINVVFSEDEESNLLNNVSSIDNSNKAIVIAFVNAHAMNLAAIDCDFHKNLEAADYLLRDGSGMSLLFASQGCNPGLNMNGTDFIPKILEAFRGRRVALWGTAQPHVQSAVDICQSKYGIEVVSLHHGFERVEFYKDLAKTKLPELIVLGMGMPKQEAVANIIRSNKNPVLIVCGGAILDFLGGGVARAPLIFRKIGVEWLYRLAIEPRRLFKRYVLGNPLFIIRLIKWRFF